MKPSQLSAFSVAFLALFATAGSACIEYIPQAAAETHHDLVKTVVEVSCTEDPVVLEDQNGNTWTFAEIPVDVTARDNLSHSIKGYIFSEPINGFFGEKWLTGHSNWLVVDDQGPDFVYCGNPANLRTSAIVTIIR